MLRRRLATGTVLVLLAIWAILWLPSFYFGIALALLVTIGAWEWAGLIRLTNVVGRSGYTVLVVLCLWLAASYVHVVVVLTVACCWWLLSLVWVLRFPADRYWWTNRALAALAGMLVLVPTWIALMEMHRSAGMGPYLVLFLLVMIWLADSAAYFAGRRWGAHLLAPRVSPGKTWEGVAGAALIVVLYAFISGLIVLPGVGLLGVFVLLCLVTLMFSIVGDLLESMFKREAGVKDSGSLLPGHGGLLDRIDSLTAAAPVFVLSLLLSGLLK
ncbi:MAG: phosphatidate cytidylyltransferase [Gammaproteobacteria bacterium]